MPTDHIEFGFLAESIAAKFLRNRGYEILFRNYKKKWGEIDIIVRKEGIVSFVEVKANRKSMAGFEPELRANWEKMRKVVRTARTFLVERKFDDDQEWQVDIVSVTIDRDLETANIKHFKNIEV